jgi:hypothetical protein
MAINLAMPVYFEDGTTFRVLQLVNVRRITYRALPIRIRPTGETGRDPRHWRAACRCFRWRDTWRHLHLLPELLWS